MPDIGLYVFLVAAVVLIAFGALVTRLLRPQPKFQWPNRPIPLPRPQGGYLERFQVVVDASPTPDSPVSWRVVESTDDSNEVKAGRQAYLDAGYRAAIVANGVFRG